MIERLYTLLPDTEHLLRILSTLFWHPTQRRLRTVWRLLIQSILMLALLTAFQAGAAFLSNTLLSAALPSLPAWLAPLPNLLFTLAGGLAVTISVTLAAHFVDRRDLTDLGFHFSRGWWLDLLAGLALGFLLMALIFSLELGLGWIEVIVPFSRPQGYPSFLGELAGALLLYCAVGFYEELYSRGYLLQNLAEGLSIKFIPPRLAILIATLLTSAYFGLLHAANPNITPLAIFNIALAGLMLAAGYLVTGQLGLSIGLHISWNFFQGAVFGFPVSGAAGLTGSFIQIRQLGPSLWTGGAFGPEGGLLGSLACTLGLAIILIWKGKKGIDLTLSQYFPAKPKSDPRSSPSPDRAGTPGQIRHIIWDWNGTLLDDLDLVLEIINNQLAARDLPPLSRQAYQEVFDFPVKNFYQKIGFDFGRESFESVSAEYIQAYERARPGCELMGGAREVLAHAASLGISQSILSASKGSYLIKAAAEYGIAGYFNAIQGLEDHYAAGKLELAEQFLASCGLPPDQLLIVGDTTHDGWIAGKLGLNCLLIPNGHHSRQRLESANFQVIDSIPALKELIL